MDERAQTLHYRHEDGSCSVRTTSAGALSSGMPHPAPGSAGERPVPPDGAVEISAGEYEAALSEVAAVNAAHVAGLVAADDEVLRTAYDELRAAGMSEAPARRLTGFLK